MEAVHIPRGGGTITVTARLRCTRRTRTNLGDFHGGFLGRGGLEHNRQRRQGWTGGRKKTRTLGLSLPTQQEWNVVEHSDDGSLVSQLQ